MIYDTDILIWIQRGNEKAARLIEDDEDKYLSIQSFMELLQGAKNKDQHQYTKGFITESAVTHRQLISLQKWWSIIMLAIGLPMGIAEVHWATQAPVFIVLNLLQYFSIRKITRTLPVSPERWRPNPPK